MRLLSWLRTRKPVGKRRKSVARLRVEHLEDRRCPAGYAITDLGALGGTTSWANAINANVAIAAATTRAKENGRIK